MQTILPPAPPAERNERGSIEVGYAKKSHPDAPLTRQNVTKILNAARRRPKSVTKPK